MIQNKLTVGTIRIAIYCIRNRPQTEEMFFRLGVPSTVYEFAIVTERLQITLTFERLFQFHFPVGDAAVPVKLLCKQFTKSYHFTRSLQISLHLTDGMDAVIADTLTFSSPRFR